MLFQITKHLRLSCFCRERPRFVLSNNKNRRSSIGSDPTTRLHNHEAPTQRDDICGFLATFTALFYSFITLIWAGAATQLLECDEPRRR
jgi:hypothetical protein